MRFTIGAIDFTGVLAPYADGIEVVLVSEFLGGIAAYVKDRDVASQLIARLANDQAEDDEDDPPHYLIEFDLRDHAEGFYHSWREKDLAILRFGSVDVGLVIVPAWSSDPRLNALTDVGDLVAASPMDTFAGFAAANRARCEARNGFNHDIGSWTLSDWMTATLGELGEAANVAKKLNRVRDGIPGNKLTEAELRDNLKQEIGDTYVYLDLLSQSQGFQLGAAAREAFDRKSAEIGYTSAKPSADIAPFVKDELEFLTRRLQAEVHATHLDPVAAQLMADLIGWCAQLQGRVNTGKC